MPGPPLRLRFIELELVNPDGAGGFNVQTVWVHLARVALIYDDGLRNLGSGPEAVSLVQMVPKGPGTLVRGTPQDILSNPGHEGPP